jgi:UDP-glucuronate 4-epimerase
MKILVTGVAGFIGMHLVEKLLSNGYQVIGIDNLNNYYDINLKNARLKNLGIYIDAVKYNVPINGREGFEFIYLDLIDQENLNKLFFLHKFDYVVNLAAQAGVRYSISNPQEYISSNIVGFHNLLEACRANPVRHLFYASSSSVYGNSNDVPFKVESSNTDNPISLYAATKKTNELLAYSYSHLFDIKTTGLRFFTVYGPYGRPDMAYYSFAKKIYSNLPIQLFGYGKLSRDFTFISDVTESILLLIKKNEIENLDSYRIFNIGNQNPVVISDFVAILEKLLDRKAEILKFEMQPGDVEVTFSDSTDLQKEIGFVPNVKIENGLSDFIDWFKAIGFTLG